MAEPTFVKKKQKWQTSLEFLMRWMQQRRNGTISLQL
ncbi:hypothetical protein Gotur_033619 [Gossypium turneri]